MDSLIIKEIDHYIREEAIQFLKDYWGYTLVVLREGEQYDVKKEQGIIACSNEEILGALMYNIKHGICEILIMNAIKENHGIGTKLISKVIEIAKGKGCHKIKVVTTNDNLNAIGFYQKRGFHLSHLYVNAMEYVRKLKPNIPELGDNGIPLRDELEFEMEL